MPISPFPALRRGPTLLALALALAACGSSASDTAEPIAATSTTESATTTPRSEATATDGTATDDTATDDTATEATATEATAAEADVVIEASFTAGAVTVEQDRVEVTQGQTVGIVLASDVDESAHVHGYDLSVPVSAGGVGALTFTADTPGVFEVELHESGMFLFEILVR